MFFGILWIGFFICLCLDFFLDIVYLVFNFFINVLLDCVLICVVVGICNYKLFSCSFFCVFVLCCWFFLFVLCVGNL